MFFRFLSLIGLVSAGLLLVIMTTQEPSSIGAFGILVVFFLGYVVILSTLTLVLGFFVRIAYILRKKSGLLRRFAYLSSQHIYYYSTVLALAPVILISLRSVGRINVYEIGLVLLFEIIALTYITKRSF
jgi:hypothetical protein|tara:strand:- start:4 stop:390 length:387 start_codon:yes stop_codon:yes gene_type:complete